jgi:hypothetical protein
VGVDIQELTAKCAKKIHEGRKENLGVENNGVAVTRLLAFASIDLGGDLNPAQTAYVL